MEGISCPRKHILNYSETRYMESWETSNKKYQPKSTDLLWEVEHGQPASDLSAKEKRFLESDRGQSTGGM